MESTDSKDEVKSWLVSMIGKMIDVRILQKLEVGRSEQVVWEGQGKVLRCVQEGAVLDLNAGGGGSLWARFMERWYWVPPVVPHWIKKPLSVPYRDLSIAQDPETGIKRLVIDAATWKRSPEKKTEKENAEGKRQPIQKGDQTDKT